MGNCSDSCKERPEGKDQQLLKNLEIMKSMQEFKNEKAITASKEMCLPLRTDRSKIVDSFGRRVKLCCYNLKGCHSTKACVSVLESLTIEELAAEIQEKGFNTVIIPFSLDLYFQNPTIQNECLGPNIWMRGKKALEILDITINGLTAAGLLVILRNACSKATYFKEFTESDGLWWNQKYSESKWIQCLANLSKRYAHNPRMIAIQIRHTLKKTSNHEPRWGSGGVLCDWKRAANLACNQVISQNQNVLVIVPGDLRGDLRNISKSPLELCEKNRLVFATKLKQQTQRIRQYDDLVSALNEDLNCIRRIGFPLILTAITDRKQSDWKLIVKYLEESDLDWGYSSYPKNSVKSSKQSIYQSLFSNQQIIKYLNKIQKSTIRGFTKQNKEKQTALKA